MRFYARDCIVMQLDESVANQFVEKYHRQGSASSSSVSYGIFNNDVLLGVVQFSRPRTKAKSNKYSLELIRMCFKDNVRVVGGASKMIKTFIREKNPADIFTYQVSHEEGTNVYLESGFSFVSQDRKKQYLVAPDKTLENAQWNGKEIFTLSYAVKAGADALLNTNIGEVFNEDGSRKTNIEIFTDVLGWHIEETKGDKVFEWVNPNYTYYTYKITATDSDKYYFGVSHVKQGNASIEDCLNDGYFGSGGNHSSNKFNNWKKKHSENLVKTVLKTFRLKMEAFAHEEKLVGDLWREDKKCLNSRRGGQVTYFYTSPPINLSMMECSKHGMVMHKGETCCTCTSMKSVSVGVCVVHGETKFSGEKCRKCENVKSVELLECSLHGVVKHNGGICCTCTSESNVSFRECEKHGLTAFQGSKCCSCTSEGLVTLEECDVHGLVKHRAGHCCSCLLKKNIGLNFCEIHGETKFLGGSCCACNAGNAISERTCEKHGLTKFTGDKCRKCLNESMITVKVCDKHGESKHIGDKCFKCRDISERAKPSKPYKPKTFNSEKTCEYCGNSFLPSSSRQKFCNNPHYINCNSCGVEMVASHQNPKKAKRVCETCLSSGRAFNSVNVERALESRSCALCGVLFSPLSNKQLFCSNPHKVNCCGCDKELLATPRKGKSLYACSRQSCKQESSRLKKIAEG